MNPQKLKVLTSGNTIGEAMKAITDGLCARRENWHTSVSRGVFYIRKSTRPEVMIDVVSPNLPEREGISGWQPLQVDLMADDWIIFHDPGMRDEWIQAVKAGQCLAGAKEWKEMNWKQRAAHEDLIKFIGVLNLREWVHRVETGAATTSFTHWSRSGMVPNLILNEAMEKYEEWRIMVKESRCKDSLDDYNFPNPTPFTVTPYLKVWQRAVQAGETIKGLMEWAASCDFRPLRQINVTRAELVEAATAVDGSLSGTMVFHLRTRWDLTTPAAVSEAVATQVEDGKLITGFTYEPMGFEDGCLLMRIEAPTKGYFTGMMPNKQEDLSA